MKDRTQLATKYVDADSHLHSSGLYRPKIDAYLKLIWSQIIGVEALSQNMGKNWKLCIGSIQRPFKTSLNSVTLWSLFGEVLSEHCRISFNYHHRNNHFIYHPAWQTLGSGRRWKLETYHALAYMLIILHWVHRCESKQIRRVKQSRIGTKV